MNNRRLTTKAYGIAFEYGCGDGYVGTSLLKEPLYVGGSAWQTSPKAGVVNGAHDAHSPKEPRHKATTDVEGKVGSFGVGVDNIGTQAQHNEEHTQRKEQCCDTLK